MSTAASRLSAATGGWFPPAAALAGLILVLFATGPGGPGVSSDVAAYFSVAENLADGEGFVQYDGSPYSSWPPLLPLILSLGPLFGGEPAGVARVFNALVFAAIVFVMSRWLMRHLQSRVLACWGGLATLFAYSIFKLSLHAWTEPVFVLLSLLFLLELFRVVEGKNDVSLIRLILIASLAWLSRYIGVTIVLTGGLVLLFVGKGKLDRRFLRAVGFGIFSSILPGLWILRNILLTGAPAGERSESSFGLLTCIKYSLKQFSWWVFPERLGSVLPVLAIAALALLAAVVGWRLRAHLRERQRRIGILLLFVAVYWAFLIWTSTRYAFEPIHSRYLIPLHPALLLSFILVADLFLERARGGIWAKLLPAAMFLWLLYPVAQTASYVQQMRTDYPDFATTPLWKRGLFSTPAWRASDLGRLLRESPPAAGETLISNFPEAVYLLAGLDSGRTPRERMHGTSRNGGTELVDFAAALRAGAPVTMLWFDDVAPHPKRGNYHALPDIAAAVRLEEVARAADGAVYRVRPRE